MSDSHREQQQSEGNRADSIYLPTFKFIYCSDFRIQDKVQGHNRSLCKPALKATLKPQPLYITEKNTLKEQPGLLWIAAYDDLLWK